MNRGGLRDAIGERAARELIRLLRRRTVHLASASPRRRELLRAAGVVCRIRPHALEEPKPNGPDWRRWVRTWALRKAHDAASHVRSGLVIGSDTIVVAGSRGLGKPADSAEAVQMLRRLSGRRHRVISGVAVIDARDGSWVSGSAVTAVYFRDLSMREIKDYVASGEPLDKAGGYAIQGRGRRLVERVDGPLDNVIGLPVTCLCRLLRRVIS